MLALVLASQALRWWCIATLGRRWNTRVIIVPGLAPVAPGPTGCCRTPTTSRSWSRGSRCRWCTRRWLTALVFTVANAALLVVRIRVENAALAHPARDGSSMRDLLVAGGGPVGLATALYAARAGLDVAVLEPRPGAIDKACGEGLMPGAVAALGDLGVPLGGAPDHRHPLPRRRTAPTAQGATVGAPRQVAEAPFRHGPGRGVRRTTLHAALGAARGRRGRARGAPARCARSRTAATTCSSTASRCGTWSRPTGCTPGCAGWSGWTSRSAARAATACARTCRWRRGPRWSRCTGRRWGRPT